MSSAVAVVRLSGESLSGIGEAVLGEEVGLDHPCPEAPSHGILNDPKIGFDEDFRRLRQKLPAIRLHASKIGFNEDFRRLRQNVFDFTQRMVMPLPENLRHLQSGDGGNREGPAKKAPCGWLGHTHRAENEAEGMEAGRKRLRAARAAWPQGGANRGSVSMIGTPLVQHVRPAEEQARQW